MKKITKNEFACNLTLSFALFFTAIHLLLVSFNLFGISHFSVPENFSYIKAYILSLSCLALYIFGFSISKFKKILFPSWLRIMFYIAFFLFTNTYYIAGLYYTKIGIVIFYAYIAFLINILSVSVFYNVQKDEKNRLKASNKFITFSVLCYSLAFSTIVQFAISAVKVIFFKKALTSTLLYFVISMSSMLVINIALFIAFYISLKNTKKFINACLVKHIVRAVKKVPAGETQKVSADEIKSEEVKNASTGNEKSLNEETKKVSLKKRKKTSDENEVKSSDKKLKKAIIKKNK